MATYSEITHSFSFTTGQQRTIDQALALLQSRLIQGDASSSPQQVRQYCRLQLADLSCQNFYRRSCNGFTHRNRRC